MQDMPEAAPEEQDLAELLRFAGPRLIPPDERADRVRATVRGTWQQTVDHRRRRRRLVTWTGLAGAAAAAGALIVFNTMPRRTASPAVQIVAAAERVAGNVTIADGSSSTTSQPLSAGRSVSTRSLIRTADGIAGLRLANGTSVRLDSGTELRVLSLTTMELDRGAVYIDSGPDAPGEIEVKTPLGTARDIGTRFEIRLASSMLRVRVRDGRVRLDGLGPEAEAGAGWEITQTSQGRITRRAIRIAGSEWDWTARAAAPFQIEGRPLGAFLEWVAREGGWRIIFSDPALETAARGIVLHGSIDGLSPADALAVVLPTCGLTHRETGDTVLIERGPSPGGRS
jgi:ferric-dicitrate binding protein FerR (iron transport regulator)